jgi:type III pantothenate kinase
VLLAIDTGNTQTVIGLFDGAELADHWRIATVASRTSDELALMIQQFLGFHGFSFDDQVTGVAVCSGVPSVTAALRAMTTRYFGFDALVIEPGVRTGMPILYDNPTASPTPSPRTSCTAVRRSSSTSGPRTPSRP